MNSTPSPQPTSRPQAASHMLWFFLLPSLLFLGWAGTRFMSAALHAPTIDVTSKLSELEKARNPGERWQAAYGLAQSLQKTENVDPKTLDTLYVGLEKVLEQHRTDVRLRKYLLLLIGGRGDPRGIHALENGLLDPDPEIRFYSAWSLTKLLLANRSAIAPHHIKGATTWLKERDPAFRKLATSFLAQLPQTKKSPEVLAMLNDSDREVRWNAGVALGHEGVKEAAPVLTEVLNLEGLRDAGFTNPDDMKATVAAAWDAAKKLKAPQPLAAAEKLRVEVKADTPEGRAIHAALR